MPQSTSHKRGWPPWDRILWDRMAAGPDAGGEYVFNFGVICAQLLCLQALTSFGLSVFVIILHFLSVFH
jgi:hypothetical protein